MVVGSLNAIQAILDPNPRRDYTDLSGSWIKKRHHDQELADGILTALVGFTAASVLALAAVVWTGVVISDIIAYPFRENKQNTFLRRMDMWVLPDDKSES